MPAGELDAGRAAFARADWVAAHAALAEHAETAEDLERLSVAAYLLARDDESFRAREAAHRAWLAAGQPERAAACAAWLGLLHLLRGEEAVGAGWLARAERILGDAPEPGPARGVLLVPAVIGALEGGDVEAASTAADEVLRIGRTFADGDVTALGLLACGEAAMARGEGPAGLRLFDEVMVGLAGDEVSPVTAGIVYCAVIEACMRAFDLRRAAAWTDALHRWCEGQPDLVPYRGQCLVHRSQVLQARGAWQEAASEAERARELLTATAHPALAAACYQRGELHRVRGELQEAEAAYREASRLGHDALPGFALLLLAEGRLDAAHALVDRMVEAPGNPNGRPLALAAAVEVLVAAGDAARARDVCDELQVLAEEFEPGTVQVLAAAASGAVQLAAGDAEGALGDLSAARDHAGALDLPYEEARARVQIARACRELGDEHTAELELDRAIALLEQLGAGPDLERARAARTGTGPPSSVLTDRECEVLRHVATGMTNREVAAALHLSEHTVARHLQNIFVKTGLSSRAAATAYAYEHGLVARGQS